MAAEEACSSLNEEAAAKGRKLEKLWRKYQVGELPGSCMAGWARRTLLTGGSGRVVPLPGGQA